MEDRRRSSILTRIASLLVRRRIRVHCKLPTGRAWLNRIDGITFYNTDEIYLRYCQGILRVLPFWVKVFAHELIHIQHQHWPHWKVYYLDDWYGRVVVGPAIRRAES